MKQGNRMAVGLGQMGQRSPKQLFERQGGKFCSPTPSPPDGKKRGSRTRLSDPEQKTVISGSCR